MTQTLETRSVLHMCNRQKGFFSARFSNEARHIYVLEIATSSPDQLQICVAAPEGRVSNLDPTDRWTATLWNQRGAYQSIVQSIKVRDALLVMTLHPQTLFLARRKSIRLAPDSRNPTRILFHFMDRLLRGFVVDFSLEGLGIETELRSDLNVGSPLYRGRFHLKGTDLGFELARVVQHSWCHPRIRLGLVFEKLSTSQEEQIQAAYHDGFSQLHSVSTVLDG